MMTSLLETGDTETVETLTEQAAQLERLLPSLGRQILWVPASHPLADLPLAQLRLCVLLQRDGRRTMSQLGEELAISVSAVTQMADRLERAGLVERVAEAGGDRRTRHLQLTDHGKTLMQSRQETRTHRASEVLRALDPAARVTVLAALTLLLEAANTLVPAASSPGSLP